MALTVKEAVSRALSGDVSAEDRALLWRVLLGVLKPSDEASLESALGESRRSYASLKEQELPDVATVSQSDDGDPLSQLLGGPSKKEDSWTKYYASADLRTEIRKDLDRLTVKGLPEDHFQPVVEPMLSVLAVWAGAKSPCGYRQGMHEVLASVVLALRDESSFEGDFSAGVSAPAKKVYFNEGDAFALFDAIMAGLLPLFAVEPERSSNGLRKKKNAALANKKDTPVLKLCKRAVDAVSLLDRDLAKMVAAVEPQLYGLRWTRLLFAREFERSPSEPLRLCDGLFAMVAGGQVKDLLSAVECAFIALVIANKRRLLDELNDYGDEQMAALAVLMRPQDVAAAHVLELATGPVLQVFHNRPPPTGIILADDDDAAVTNGRVVSEPPREPPNNPFANLAVLLEDAVYTLDKSVQLDNVTARRAILQVADVASRLRQQPPEPYT